MLVAFFGFFLHIVEGIEHQQGVFEGFGGDGGELVVVEQLDQRMDILAAARGALPFSGVFLADQLALRAAFGLGCQI